MSEHAALQAKAELKRCHEAAERTEGAVKRLEEELEPRRRVVYSLALQLSDALSRSGCVSRDAPFLVDAAASNWEWERLAPQLASLASHAIFYWDAVQAEATQLKAQIDGLRRRLKEREGSLARAAALATNLRQVSWAQTGSTTLVGPAAGGAKGPAGQAQGPRHISPASRRR